MMKVLEGIRVVELASWLFVPAAGAILADWGADVIKIEHPRRPDPQRKLVVGGMSDGEPFHALMQQANRGKRSIGLDGASREGYVLLRELVGSADVFLTNLLPKSRARLSVEVEDIRAMNPQIVYAAGTGYGPQGPEVNTPGFDGTTYWARGGIADAFTPAWDEQPIPVAPAMGDLPGATSVAGAIAAGLLHRERTGEPAVVDVSLLNVAVWGAAPAIIAAAQRGAPSQKAYREDSPNPATLAYRTKDGRFVKLSLFESDRYFDELCACLGVPELAVDERFTDSAVRAEHRAECVAALDGAFAELTLDEVVDAFGPLTGAWSVVQTVDEVGRDPQVLANGYLTEVGENGACVPVAASPWQFGRTRYPLAPAPAHAAHTDEILHELGVDAARISCYRESGTVG